MVPATTIDEVISQLDSIIASETLKGSTMAFFPVLYRKVTLRIKEGIAKNEFENNVRMEKLDVLFANRYIEAYHQYNSGLTLSESWKAAFNAAKENAFLIMQHLLLGINAHINLDLGVAVAKTVGEHGDLADFEKDFNTINEILGSMVDDVQQRIGKVSPMFFLLEKVGKGREDKVVTFSINIARDGAWLFANQYHISPRKDTELSERDRCIALVAQKLTTTKSRVLRFTIRSIRFFETKNVAKVIATLNS